jgi:hypothetical protein
MTLPPDPPSQPSENPDLDLTPDPDPHFSKVGSQFGQTGLNPPTHFKTNKYSSMAEPLTIEPQHWIQKVYEFSEAFAGFVVYCISYFLLLPQHIL